MIYLVLFALGALLYLAIMWFFDRYLWKELSRWTPRVFPAFVVFCVLLEGIPMVAIYHFLFPDPLLEGISVVGFWLTGFLLYFFLLVVVWSLLQGILGRALHKQEAVRSRKAQLLKLALSAAFSAAICIYGGWALQNPVVTEFSAGSGTERLRVAVLSDIHYGTVGGTVDLLKMVERVNALEPDLVLLAGDVIDNRVEALDHAAFVDAFQKFQTTYGVFAVMGNHEYELNTYDAVRRFYEGSGVRLLDNETVEVGGKLRLLGRTDYLLGGAQKARLPLSEILDGSDSSLPLVVIDHQPQDYRDAEQAGAILQVSGHTHNGQLWPGDLLMNVLNAVKYQSPSNGIHRYGSFTLAVTRGYGAWGFQMRLTGNAELLLAEVAVP